VCAFGVVLPRRASGEFRRNSSAPVCPSTLAEEAWPRARFPGTKALELAPGHLRARYRLGVALSRLHDSASGWDLAANEFRRCLERDPNMRDAQRQLAALEKRIKAQGKKEKKRCGVMFSGVV